MEKKLLILFIVIFLSTAFLSGCERADVKGGKNNPNFSKFIGEWLEEGNAPNNLTWIFYENYTVKFIQYTAGNTGNYYIYWGTFGLEGDLLEVQSDKIHPVCDKFTYEFSNEDTKITLTSEYGGDITTLNQV